MLSSIEARPGVMSRFSHLIAILALSVSLAMGAPRKNVLILHEGFELLPYQALMTDKLHEDLSSNASVEVQLFEEYLDSWRLNQDMGSLAAALETKYSGRAFDLVIADGTGALRLLANNPPAFLRGTPAVFVSVLHANIPPKLPANITGIETHLGIAATVRLAQTLQPDLEHLYYIESDPLTDVEKDKVLRGEFQPFRGLLDVVLWERDELGVLLKKLGKLPPHSAVLFDSYYEDPHGQTYIPAKICALVAVSTNAPVYTLYQTMVGSGALGGVVVNFNDIERQASRIILAVLNGASVSEFPVLLSRNEVMIDWRQLVRFRFPESALPPGSIVQYKSPTVWEQYRWRIVAICALLIAQSLLIFGLLIQRRQRKRAEESLRDMTGRLLQSQDDERRRIARDLHDGTGQHLSGIALSVGQVLADFPAGYDRLRQLLQDSHSASRQALNEVRVVSYVLHPPILDGLGLIPALHWYLDGLQKRTNFSIDFEAPADIANMNPDAERALFRIVQESINNVLHHSGGTAVSVRLLEDRKAITLEIQDNGHGMSTEELERVEGASSLGVGIAGMRERVQQLHGTFEISSNGSGTRVLVSLPRHEERYATHSAGR
jgi:signal transduction histidine kinase